MRVSLLTPNLERRLGTIISLKDRKKDHINIKNPTITLSREFGCEAFPLAELLSEKLNSSTKSLWTIYDKELISRISENENLNETFLSHIEDTSHFGDFMASFGSSHKTHDEIYNIMKQYIAKIAIEGNAIIVGRGSHLVTEDFTNCLHFRIEAPLEMRVRSISERLDLSYEEASKVVVEGEKKRQRFYMEFFDKNPSSIDQFHAIFNSGKLTLEEMANTITSLVEDYIDSQVK